MAKRKNAAQTPLRTAHGRGGGWGIGPSRKYDRALRLFFDARYEEARGLYAELESIADQPELCALATNDLAVLDALAEDFVASRRGFRSALALDPTCEPARRNLASLVSCGCGSQGEAPETGSTLAALGAPDGARNGFAERAGRNPKACAPRIRQPASRSASLSSASCSTGLQPAVGTSTRSSWSNF